MVEFSSIKTVSELEHVSQMPFYSSFARDCCMIYFNLLYLFSYKVIIVLFKFYGLCCIVN